LIPVVTPAEMAEVDRSAPEPVEVLIERAGFAVARSARFLLGGTYGRRILVVAGRGNNGADGRIAGRCLSAWGAAVKVLEAESLAPRAPLPPADLIIDAAYGTGLTRPYIPPDPGDTPVLAVDIPSGLSGVTGTGTALSARRTVTFAAFKPGLLIGDGPDLCGDIEVAHIGLESLAAATARAWVVTDEDVFDSLPRRPRRGHKWQTAVLVVGGNPTMNGAPLLTAHAALRAGAGYALVAVPGSPPGAGLPPGEHVGHSLPLDAWSEPAAALAERARAIAVGPGLGEAGGPVADFLAATDAPAVVDADGLSSLGDPAGVRDVTSARRAPLVLTPHEGEYRRLTGHSPAADRITDVREVAGQTGAVVLLKGSPTIVADPDGRVLVARSGSPRLATAGTGDVLSGVIAAFLARGVPALEAAALGAHCHGRAASLGFREGLVAGDLPELVAEWLSR
jgi:ADP-dependent NAD(P)H-hydrate dehydratase / NAD(P)H-hydrate epimerase